VSTERGAAQNHQPDPFLKQPNIQAQPQSRFGKPWNMEMITQYLQEEITHVKFVQ